MKNRKSILWSLGPAAYLAGVTVLIWIPLMIGAPLLPLNAWMKQALLFLWVGLLAVAALWLWVHQHKLAGCIMAAAAIAAAMISTSFVFV